MSRQRAREDVLAHSMVATVLRKGPADWAVRARYRALAKRFGSDVPLGYVETVLANWYAIAEHRKAKGLNTRRDDIWRGQLREARILLRFIRSKRLCHKWLEILATVKMRPTL